MLIEKESWGSAADGAEVLRFTLRNPAGAFARVTSYGAILTEWHVPDRTGTLANVVHGFDHLEAYLRGHPGFGATIGRVANRIRGARFDLDGQRFDLAKNNGPNHLHGGLRGFDKFVWEAFPLRASAHAAALRFTRLSSHMEEGYPGNVRVSVTYTLTADHALRLDYTASSDRATPLNLTNHSYFNLAGAGDVLDHEVTIPAESYTPVDATLIPTGEIASVRDTPLDFRQTTRIGERIALLKPVPGGYDHNYVLPNHGAAASCLVLAARVRDAQSGRTLEVHTSEPGMQFYTGNFLDGRYRGVGGAHYVQHSGLCLETQHFPDSVNKPQFPSVILRPGEVSHSTTIYRFTSD
jgi:aldose 1-epimerase